MKIIVFLTAGLLLPALVGAQPTVVSWSFTAEKAGQGTYDLQLKASIKSGWYLYSQHLDDGGPIPTRITFDTAEGITLAGETAEKGPLRKEGFDELFGMNVIKYGGEVVFTQRIRTGPRQKEIRGSVEFMTCDDEQCLPPRTIPFSIALPE